MLYLLTLDSPGLLISYPGLALCWQDPDPETFLGNGPGSTPPEPDRSATPALPPGGGRLVSTPRRVLGVAATPGRVVGLVPRRGVARLSPGRVLGGVSGSRSDPRLLAPGGLPRLCPQGTESPSESQEHRGRAPRRGAPLRPNRSQALKRGTAACHRRICRQLSTGCGKPSGGLWCGASWSSHQLKGEDHDDDAGTDRHG
jgi:hypothetical protein